MGGLILDAPSVARSAAPSVDRRTVRFEHEGKVLRALRGEPADFLEGLLRSASLERVFEAGLARFWRSDIRVEGFDLVIECQRVPVVSYPPEWPPVMLREAGLMTARLGKALAAIGAGLSDAHPWNVLFHATRPVWVDIGSVVPLDRVTDAWVDEFRRHTILPLALHALRWHSMAGSVERDDRGDGVKRLWEARPIRGTFPFGYARLARGPRDPGSFFGRLERYLEVSRPREPRGEWSCYSQAPGATPGESASYDTKQRAVDRFLAALPKRTVLDVGANAGWFSELAVHHGHRVTALDTDDATLSRLYRRADAARLPILPLRMDIMWPTGSHGLGLAYADARTRLRSDITMWLAVVHHLCGRQGYGLETIAGAIDAFTGEAAIVEFVPRDDAHVRTWPRASEPWWDVDHFIAAMRPFFAHVETLPSSPSPRLMLCFRREAPS